MILLDIARSIQGIIKIKFIVSHPNYSFLRHWNRGDYNSCCRTDLTFKPVPESKLARKRDERLRKQAEKDREEREKVQVVSD